MAGIVAKKIEEGVGAGATALTAKAQLIQAGDATAQAARVTGVAEAAKGKGIAGKAGKAVASRAAGSRAGQAVAKAAAARAPATMPGMISRVAATPGLGAASKVVSGLARFAPWVAGANAAIGAVRGGYDAYEKGGGALDVAKGAAWGAADQVTVGLASWAYGKGGQVARGIGNAIAPSENRATSAEVGSSGVGPADKARKTRGIQDTPMPREGLRMPGLIQQPAWNNGGNSGNGSLSPDQSRAFNAASQHYAGSHTDKPPPENGPNGNGLRGFQISKVQAAAQAAKGYDYQGPEE